MSQAEVLVYDIRPPTTNTIQKVGKVSVTSSAATVNLYAHLAAADVPNNGARHVITVKAVDGNAFILFKNANSAAAVTVANGYPIINGSPEAFVAGVDKYGWMEVVSASTCNLYYYISSPTVGGGVYGK